MALAICYAKAEKEALAINKFEEIKNEISPGCIDNYLYYIEFLLKIEKYEVCKKMIDEVKSQFDLLFTQEQTETFCRHLSHYEAFSVEKEIKDENVALLAFVK